MLLSWIKQFIRVSGKGKFYTIVNILGLAIGLACTIIILLWADFQRSYDKFHDDFQRIYQVYEIQEYTDGYRLYTYSTPAPLTAFLNLKFPEIEKSTRFNNTSSIIGIGDKAFRESKIGFTDSTFFKIFKVDFISGDRNHCLKDINSIVLTEMLANKIFGKLDVIGKSVRLNGNIELKVTAIIKDYPKNSNISFTCLIPFEKLVNFGFGGLDQWGWNSHRTYAKLNITDPQKVKSLEEKIQVETKKMGVGANTNFHLYPLEKVRLFNPNPNDFSFILLVTILLSAAGFVLVLACINFINLITARSVNRAKEVGIRKVVGSSKIQLVTQYFMESFLNTLVSLFIAILLVDFVLPTFNQTLGTELRINFSDFFFWSKVFLVVIVVGFVSGIYPALVLSSFQPANVLKGIFHSGTKKAGFRKAMVIIQYTLTIHLVVITFFLVHHLNYIMNMDTGMSRKNVIYFPFKKEMGSNYRSFKNELLKIPGVKYVSGTRNLPFLIYNSTSNINWKGKDTTQSYLFSNTGTDESLADLMEIKMIEGRYYSSQFSTDTSCVVLNETAAKIINKNPILGEVINIWGEDLKVIGVIKDFNFTHLADKIQPLFLYYSLKRYDLVLIKARQSFDKNTMDQIKKVFSDFYPEQPFESTSLEDEFQRSFPIEKQIKTIIGQFTILAILISCVGLLSLAAYIAEQQRKSLVLRKIHGASLMQILIILIGSFTKWVLYSGLIAIPLSYLVLKGIFSNYYYHAKFSWWIFAGALFASLMIAILTVLYQALKTSRINPAETLRYE